MLQNEENVDLEAFNPPPAELSDLSHIEKCHELANVLENNLLGQDLKVSMFIIYARKMHFDESLINELIHNRMYIKKGLKDMLDKIPPLNEIWLNIKKNKSDLLNHEVINFLYYFLIVNNKTTIRKVRIEELEEVSERRRKRKQKPMHVFEILQKNSEIYDKVVENYNIAPAAAYWYVSMDSFYNILYNGVWGVETLLLRNEVFRLIPSIGDGWKNSLLGSSLQYVGIVRYIPVNGKFIYTDIFNDHYIRILDTQLANLDYIVVYKGKRTGFIEIISKFAKWCSKNKMFSLIGLSMTILIPMCVEKVVKSGFLNEPEQRVVSICKTVYSIAKCCVRALQYI